MCVHRVVARVMAKIHYQQLPKTIVLCGAGTWRSPIGVADQELVTCRNCIRALAKEVEQALVSRDGHLCRCGHTVLAHVEARNGEYTRGCNNCSCLVWDNT